MVVLLDIHDFDSLLSTQRCDIVLFKLAGCMLSSTQEMVTYPYMSCGTWCEGRERPSPIECFTMPPVCVAPSSTGNVNGVVCCLWLTHWVYPQSSTPTVQQTSNGLSWLNLSALTTLIPGLPVPRQSLRTQPLQTGSSTIESLSSPILSTLESLEPLTTG